MDLAGEIMQITWLVSHSGDVKMSFKVAFSFPYGAAALRQKLDELEKMKESQ